MNRMRLISSYLLIVPLVWLITVPVNGQINKVQISNDSKLSIQGTSNVTDFRCFSEHNLQNDSLTYNYQFEDDRVLVFGLTLSLDVDQFDCGKKAINRDFKSSLRYKEYPFIHITLNELMLADPDQIVPDSAHVTINIAGTARDYIISLNAYSTTEEYVLAGGSKVLYMTDFGLEPPTVMFGLIKVRDELSIDFDLVIRFSE